MYTNMCSGLQDVNTLIINKFGIIYCASPNGVIVEEIEIKIFCIYLNKAEKSH